MINQYNLDVFLFIPKKLQEMISEFEVIRGKDCKNINKMD